MVGTATLLAITGSLYGEWKPGLEMALSNCEWCNVPSLGWQHRTCVCPDRCDIITRMHVCPNKRDIIMTTYIILDKMGGQPLCWCTRRWYMLWWSQRTQRNTYNCSGVVWIRCNAMANALPPERLCDGEVWGGGCSQLILRNASPSDSAPFRKFHKGRSKHNFEKV